MANLSDVQAKLASLAISGHDQILTHATSTSQDEYKTAVASASSSAAHIKTLVFKPKTAKTAKPVPVIIIAKDETETNTAALSKKLDIKDMRLAAADLLQECFSATKDDSKSFVPSTARGRC